MGTRKEREGERGGWMGTRKEREGKRRLDGEEKGGWKVNERGIIREILIN